MVFFGGIWRLSESNSPGWNWTNPSTSVRLSCPTEIMNIKDMDRVKCAFCGSLFVMAQAVVLDDKGEFQYYCDKDCAMKAMAKGMTRPRVKLDMPIPT